MQWYTDLKYWLYEYKVIKLNGDSNYENFKL
jgi:hypothetical protein